jgi:copper resistance protein B
MRTLATLLVLAALAALPAHAQPAPSGEAPSADDPMEAMAWPESAPEDAGPSPPMDHAAMGHTAPADAVGDAQAPPPPADHAADRVFDPAAMERARAVLRDEHGGGSQSKLTADLAEYQVRDGDDGYRWDAEAWFGGDLDRLVVKSEGDGAAAGLASGEIQALYSRAIGPYFDLQAGVRQDIQRGPKRTYAVLGFEGLAPYWFEVEGALFLSGQGEFLARLEASYDLRLTQRWIVQPRVEANLAAQDIAELGLGAGISDVEAGVRLRYEVSRQFAPYVGVSWERKLGRTSDFARAAGEDAAEAGLVIGVRAFY